MKINLTSATRLQTLKGWGVSSCWWSQCVSQRKTAEELASLFYSSDGLNLNIYRYNAGGGFDSGNCRVNIPWRKTESLYCFDRETEKGYFDFSLDKNAREFMKICLSHGNIDTLILFANSPHWSQTSTGQSSGSLLYHTCNLPKANYRRFADYLLTITEHFIDEGLPVSYLSPVNEPQWKWGGSYVWQEGCHFETDELTELYRVFAEEMDNRKTKVLLYGPESGEMNGLTAEYLNEFEKDEKIMKHLGVFAYHSYHADNEPELRKSFKNNIVSTHSSLRFDMSEWCELPCKNDTKSIKSAQIAARVIGQDLILGGCESWTAWVGVNMTAINKDDGLDYCDGLISANEDFSQWYVTKRYYALAHFSKFIPVGSVCLDTGFTVNETNDFNAFTFLTPEGKTVIVAVNELEKTQTLELNGGFDSMEVVETTAQYNLRKIYSGAFDNKLDIKSAVIVTAILS